jgi:hypothetical protein
MLTRLILAWLLPNLRGEGRVLGHTQGPGVTSSSFSCHLPFHCCTLFLSYVMSTHSHMNMQFYMGQKIAMLSNRESKSPKGGGVEKFRLAQQLP